MPDCYWNHWNYGLALDKSGAIYFANESTLFRTSSKGEIQRLADVGISIASIALAPDGSIYAADQYDNTVRKATPVNLARVLVASGDGQAGLLGAQLPTPLTVQIMGSDGLGVPGVAVDFVVTKGDATLDARTRVSGADGRVGVTVLLGATPGPITVTATVAGLTAVTFNLTAKADPDTPVIAPGGIAQNGFSVPPVADVSPSAITSIFGSNFAASGSVPVSAGLIGGRMPTLVNGLCVTFGEVRAPILAVSPTQVTVQVPNVAAGSTAVQVLRYCDQTGVLKSNHVTVTSRAATPEFLYLRVNADGRNPVAAVSSSNEWIGAPGSIPGVALTPARPGDVLVLYALGLGSTTPTATPGTPPTTAAGQPRLSESP